MRKYIDKDETLRRDLLVRPVEDLHSERTVLVSKATALMGSDEWLYEDLLERDEVLHYEIIDYDSAIDALDMLAAGVAHAATEGAQLTQNVIDAHLRDAARYGRLEECRTLLERGADTAAADAGWAALHYAAVHGHPQVCALLIERGASLGALIAGDLTPFQLAVRHGQPAVVDYFVEAYGESLDQLTSKGDTLDELAKRAADNGVMAHHLMARRSERTMTIIDASLPDAADASRGAQPRRASMSL
jgi:hypothetical protein